MVTNIVDDSRVQKERKNSCFSASKIMKAQEPVNGTLSMLLFRCIDVRPILFGCNPKIITATVS